MLADLPYDTITVIFSFLEEKDKKRLFKSFDKEIYEKAINSSSKIELYDRYYISKIVNSQVAIARNLYVNKWSVGWMPKIKYKNTDIIHIGSFKKSLRRVVFPDGITHLNLVKFCKKLEKVYLSKDGLTSYALPDSITHLTLGDNFNQKLDNLPNSLTHLTLGYAFNQKLDNLPNSLTHLTLGDNFNQKLDNLPNRLTHLTLGYTFNQKLDNLPNSLTHLTLGYAFNQKLDSLHTTVKNLKYLKIPFRYKKDLSNVTFKIEYIYEFVMEY